MSSYDITSQKVQLVADANDPTTEVFVIDGHFDRVAKGHGRIDTELAPGLYKVKFKAGSLCREVHVTLETGSAPVTINPPDDLLFSTSAPIPKTSTTHEYHEHNAYQLSMKVHREIGTGSQLFVFVRDLDKRGRNDPATDLTLYDLAGNLLVDFTKEGEREIHDPNRDYWTGCTAQLDPGSYRLRVRTHTVGTLEQVVVTNPGWQTQVFLLRRLYGYKHAVRRADLGNASILMAPIGRGFDPFRQDRVDLRQAELARQGLANQRLVLEASELRKMLWAKLENPMLGIYGAHLLLLSQEPDRGLLREVISNLHNLVGTHPDVTALDVWLGEMTNPFPVYEAPPMLRSSWRVIVKASISHPEIVPVESFAGRISDRVWGDGAWLTWEKPSKGGSSQQIKPVDFSVLRDALPQIVDMLAETKSSQSDIDVGKASRLNTLEQLLLEYVSTATSPTRPAALSSESAVPLNSEEWLQTWASANLTGESLVQAFGVPYAPLSEAATGLVQKLTIKMARTTARSSQRS